MTPLKCFHLNSVTRFILITILVSIFSQSFDCKSITPQTNASKPVFIETLEDGKASQTIDNVKYSDSTNSAVCTGQVCIDMAPAKDVDRLPEDKDTKSIGHKRSAIIGNNDVSANAESYEVNGNVFPEHLLYTLKDYKIVMDPSVKKVNDHDYRLTLHVDVIRKWDNRREMSLPSINMPFDMRGMISNSSIDEKLKEELSKLSSSNNTLTNINLDRSADSASKYVNVVTTPTPTNFEVYEDATPSYIQPDQNNQTSDAVSSSSLSTNDNHESRSKITGNEDNNIIATIPATSSTMEPLITTESYQSLTPLPSNVVERRQEKSSTNQPEITTTPKDMITTPNPIDLTSASIVANLVRPSKTSQASSNVFTLSTEVSKVIESRIISSTSSPLQTSGSSSIQPKMSEIELNQSKSLYNEKTYKPIKPIPETPWIPAYEVKAIGSNRQDSEDHIEYRFTQHDNEINSRRNIPSIQPKPVPKPQLKPQPQPQPQPRLTSQPRYGPGLEMRTNNDRQQKMVKSNHPNTYVPRNPSVPLNRQANVPNNRNEPYAVEEIVHFEGPMQRLNTRQDKPPPELFVRIIRHYFDNALGPAETIYTTKHRSPVINPGQPLYQRPPSSLSYRNSKP